MEDERTTPEEVAALTTRPEDDGVKAVGGSKAVRYDTEETTETNR